MYKSRPIFVLVALVLTTVGTASARTWHVPSEYPTIGVGVDSASAGDTVLVAPGTYKATTRIDLAPGVCLTSEQGPEVTIIEICLAGIGIGLANCEGGRVVGFTVRNSPEPECRDIYMTYGFWLYSCTDVAVENCIIENVDVGIRVRGPSTAWWMPVISNNTIRNCVYGIECGYTYDPGRPSIEGNTITECYSGAWVYDSSPMFVGNQITHCRDYGIWYWGACGGGGLRNVIAHNQGEGVHIEVTPINAVPGFSSWMPEDANDFYDNGSYDIWYTDTTCVCGIDVRYNYWGSNCPDFTHKLRGCAFYNSPWVDATHTKTFTPSDCQGATEPATWGAIKAMFK